MNLLFLTILFPLLGYLLLAFSRGRWSERQVALVGVGSVAFAAGVAGWVGVEFLQQPRGVIGYTQLLWISLSGFLVFGDIPDAHSLIGMAIIVGAGLYVAWGHRYVKDEEPDSAIE